MKFFTLVPVCLLVTASFAQDANDPFHGKWKAEWLTDKKMQLAHFTLDAKGGTWKTLSDSRGNPCIGREVRIQVETPAPDERTLKLKFSEAITGCADATVHLKRIDDKTIAGTRGKAEVKVTRE